jgi:hypothetical protein
MAQYDNDADVDGFLAHRGSAYESGAFLGTKWHKDGKIDVWFFTRLAPKPRWKHGWQQIKAITNRETRAVERQVWSADFVCWEPERVLKNRDRDETGARVEPFYYCGGCRLVEEVRLLIREGKLSWVAPAFHFAGDDPRKSVTIHAGGLFNAYAARDGADVKKLGIPPNRTIMDALAQAQPPRDPADWWRAEMAAAHIIPREAWKENFTSKLEYVMLVVPNANPDGVKIAIEPDLLGQKIQKMIADVKQSMNDDVKGNPFKTPYCVRFIADKNAKDIKDRYNAIRLESVPLTPQIEKLIRGTNAPDITPCRTPGDQKTLRAQMERYADPNFKKLIDWDRIFKVRDPEDAGTSTSVTKPVMGNAPTPVGTATPQPLAETIPCDDCKYPMKPNEAKCPNCGVEYDVKDDASPIAGVPVVTAPVSTNAVGGAPAAAPMPVAGADDPYGGEPGGGDDDIPFLRPSRGV